MWRCAQRSPQGAAVICVTVPLYAQVDVSYVTYRSVCMISQAGCLSLRFAWASPATSSASLMSACRLLPTCWKCTIGRRYRLRRQTETSCQLGAGRKHSSLSRSNPTPRASTVHINLNLCPRKSPAEYGKRRHRNLHVPIPTSVVVRLQYFKNQLKAHFFLMDHFFFFSIHLKRGRSWIVNVNVNVDL